MIASLRGTVLHIQQPSFLVVEVGGVGFKVSVPASVFDDLDGVGRNVFLHTYLMVREDALNLYGFSTQEQRALLELLLTVQGVGPRVALSILSALSPRDLIGAIAARDQGSLTRAPGVGARLAARTIARTFRASIPSCR